MQYMLLIYQKDMGAAQQDQAAMAKVYQEYQALNDDLKRRGQFISNHGLKPASTATTIEVRDGRIVRLTEYFDTRPLMP